MLTDLKRRVLLSPDDAEARYALGEHLFGEGDHDGAEKQLTRALALDPDHAGARRLLARTYRAQGREVPAERTLDEAVLRHPDDAGAREEMADLLASVRRYDEAILHLEEALRVDTEHRSRRLRVIDLCLVRGLVARASRHIAEARRRDPEDPEVASRTQAALLYEGRAAGVLRSALLEGSEALFARTRRALDAPPLAEAVRTGPLRAVAVALREGNLATAKRALVTAPPEAQHTAAFELLRAEVTLLEGDRARGEAAFRRATERAPEAALAWMRLGELELAAGRAPSGASALARASALAPADAGVKEMLGDALFAVGRTGEALGHYEAAMALRPEVFLSAKIAELKASGGVGAVAGSEGAPDVARGNRTADHRTVVDATAGARTAARERGRANGAIGRIGALAWNPTGGIVSPLQAEAVPGNGELHLTGNVHGTGQEAGRVVHSLLKARASSFDIEAAVAQRDLHLHYADADFRKEGASAGIALALAALSAYWQRPLPAGLAATGQLSLDGGVIPVAGLAEKLLAAYLGDIQTVIAPRKNLFAIRGLPREVEGRLRVVFVDSLREAIDAVWERA